MSPDLNAVHADYEAWQTAHQAFDTDQWHLTANRLAGWVPDLLAALSDPHRDPMYHDAYMSIQRLLDKALGPNVEDGAGAGLQEEVALVVAQRDQARADLAAVEQDRDRLQPILEAAVRWREGFDDTDPLDPDYYTPDECGLAAAVDAWLATGGATDADALDPNAPPIEAVLHTLGDVIAPDESTGRTRCPLCKTLPIGHEGDCEP